MLSGIRVSLRFKTKIKYVYIIIFATNICRYLVWIPMVLLMMPLKQKIKSNQNPSWIKLFLMASEAKYHKGTPVAIFRSFLFLFYALFWPFRLICRKWKIRGKIQTASRILLFPLLLFVHCKSKNKRKI